MEPQGRLRPRKKTKREDFETRRLGPEKGSPIRGLAWKETFRVNFGDYVKIFHSGGKRRVRLPQRSPSQHAESKSVGLV